MVVVVSYRHAVTKRTYTTTWRATNAAEISTYLRERTRTTSAAVANSTPDFPTTSAVLAPEGTLRADQSPGKPGKVKSRGLKVVGEKSGKLTIVTEKSGNCVLNSCKAVLGL